MSRGLEQLLSMVIRGKTHVRSEDVSKEEVATTTGDPSVGSNNSDTNYLDKAIALSVKSVDACSDDIWDRARLLNNLGNRLRQRVPFSQSDN